MFTRAMFTRAALVLLAISSLATPASAQCDCPAMDTLVIGHRGAGTDDGSELFPENTIESAQQAFTEGADMVEIDVQLTSDGSVVLMHDDTVNRTTDGMGCVSALTLADIQGFTAGDTTVPTLSEFFGAVPGGVNVEVKLHEGASCPAQDLNMLADAVAATIVADAGSRRILVSSFDIDVLRRIRATEPAIPIGYLSIAAGDIDVVMMEGFEAINFISVVATARNVRLAHDAGLLVNVWTVDGADAVGSMLALDVDGVITDTADAAVMARMAYCDSYVCPVDGGVGADAGPGGGGGDGGCGCGVAPASNAPVWLLGLAFALVLFRRQR